MVLLGFYLVGKEDETQMEVQFQYLKTPQTIKITEIFVDQ